MLREFGLFVFLILLFVSEPLANEAPSSVGGFSNCWVDAGRRYQINPWLLYAIATQESSLNYRAINHNRNKSRDIGLMQINSFWLAELKKYGLSEERLFDPCTNIHVGAWILSQSIKVFGNNWRAVGAYNAGTGKSLEKEKMRQKYAKSVYKHYLGFIDGRL